MPPLTTVVKAKHIETMPFHELMAEALVAYARDPEYAILMAKAATQIRRKRVVWTIRTAVRQAETAAVTACSKVTPFTCTNPSPCGSGPGCRYAAGELALLEVDSRPGKSTRPQTHSHGTSYDTEVAVHELVRQHEASRQLL